MPSATDGCPICGGSPFPRSQTSIIGDGLADGPSVVTEDTEEIQTRNWETMSW